jgi:hypothetical protein
MGNKLLMASPFQPVRDSARGNIAQNRLQHFAGEELTQFVFAVAGEKLP